MQNFILKVLTLCAVCGLAYANELEGATESFVPQSDATSCIHVRQMRQVEIVNEEWFVIFGSHDRMWLNKLNTRCLGAQRNMPVSFDRFGQKVCENDRVTTDGLRLGELSSSCRLGEFIPTTVAEVASLKASLVEG